MNFQQATLWQNRLRNVYSRSTGNVRFVVYVLAYIVVMRYVLRGAPSNLKSRDTKTSKTVALMQTQFGAAIDVRLTVGIVALWRNAGDKLKKSRLDVLVDQRCYIAVWRIVDFVSLRDPILWLCFARKFPVCDL